MVINHQNICIKVVKYFPSTIQQSTYHPQVEVPKYQRPFDDISQYI